MRKWIRIILRLLILFFILSVAIYIFLPSTLSVRETVAVKCPQRLIYLKLADPNYWISRSRFFYSKEDNFRIDSSSRHQPYVYSWINKNKTKGFIRLREEKRYESIIYQVCYEPESEGDLIFNLSYQKETTTIAATLELDLPSSIWKKVKAYLWYFSIKQGVRNELKSLAMDCQMNSKPLHLTIRRGEINDFKALIRKLYIPKTRSVAAVADLFKLYKAVPPSSISGQPCIQYVSNPYNDTLIVIVGVPVKSQEIVRIPNASLSLFSHTQTLFTTFSLKNDNADDVYNQLLYEAKARGKNADSYPLIFINYRTKRATMHLPIER